MTVTVLTPWWPTAAKAWYAGFVRYQAMALASLGSKVDVVWLRPPWVRTNPLPAEGTRISSRSLWLPPRYLFAPFSWRLGSSQLRGRLPARKGAAALVHTEVLAAIACPELRRAGVPYWVCLHGEDTNPAPTATAARREAISRGLREAAGVVVVGRSLIPVAARLGADPRHCVVVENGYDLEVNDVATGDRGARPSPTSEVGAHRISCVGNLQPEKGQDDLLEAVALLRAEGRAVHVDFVGDGPSRAGLTALAGRLGLAGAVSFHGALAPGLAAQVIAGSDLFVLPSRREALGIVYLNAMALGIPVVGIRGTGIDGIVEEGKSGFLADGEDPKGLASLLGRLLGSPSLRAAVGSEGCRLARERYTWRWNASRIHDLLSADGAA